MKASAELPIFWKFGVELTSILHVTGGTLSILAEATNSPAYDGNRQLIFTKRDGI